MASGVARVLTKALNIFGMKRDCAFMDDMEYMKYKTATSVLYANLPEMVICQEKYDGMFVRMTPEGQMYSRTNHHIGSGQIIGWANPTKYTCLGEIVGCSTRQKTIGLVAKMVSGNITDEEAETLTIRWFDCLSGGIFEERLERLFEHSRYEPDYVKVTKKVAYDQAVDFVRRGKEGAMVSSPTALYTPSIVSNNHLKLKRSYEADFKVVDFKKGLIDGSLLVESEDENEPIRTYVKYSKGVFHITKGDIVAIRFMEVTKGSLTHPRIMAICRDKLRADTKAEILASKPFISWNYKLNCGDDI